MTGQGERVHRSDERCGLAHAYALSDGGVLALTSAGNLVHYDAALRPIVDAVGTPKIAMFETAGGTLVLATSRDGLFTLQNQTLVPAQ